MNKSQFAHVIRSACAIVGVDRVLVIGTQAAHASLGDGGDIPGDVSVEADIAVFGDGDGRASDLIDGSIGEGSMFHDTFGYYGHGVSEHTARLPAGWRDRLIAFRGEATGGNTAYCLDPHDLWLSKAYAGREKDKRFCAALLRSGHVDSEILRGRLETMPGVPPEKKAIIVAVIDAGGTEPRDPLRPELPSP